ncbi:unnamed protein product [Amoebophrya sp. A25]|nr:unnamed protein product [Amoebophrya sp. A25]|eukprot:GSA25T00004875001.1
MIASEYRPHGRNQMLVPSMEKHLSMVCSRSEHGFGDERHQRMADQALDTDHKDDENKDLHGRDDILVTPKHPGPSTNEKMNNINDASSTTVVHPAVGGHGDGDIVLKAATLVEQHATTATTSKKTTRKEQQKTTFENIPVKDLVAVLQEVREQPRKTKDKEAKGDRASLFHSLVEAVSRPFRTTDVYVSKGSSEAEMAKSQEPPLPQGRLLSDEDTVLLDLAKAILASERGEEDHSTKQDTKRRRTSEENPTTKDTKRRRTSEVTTLEDAERVLTQELEEQLESALLLRGKDPKKVQSPVLRRQDSEPVAFKILSKLLLEDPEEMKDHVKGGPRGHVKIQQTRTTTEDKLNHQMNREDTRTSSRISSASNSNPPSELPSSSETASAPSSSTVGLSRTSDNDVPEEGNSIQVPSTVTTKGTSASSSAEGSGPEHSEPVVSSSFGAPGLALPISPEALLCAHLAFTTAKKEASAHYSEQYRHTCFRWLLTSLCLVKREACTHPVLEYLHNEELKSVHGMNHAHPGTSKDSLLGKSGDHVNYPRSTGFAVNTLGFGWLGTPHIGFTYRTLKSLTLRTYYGGISGIQVLTVSPFSPLYGTLQSGDAITALLIAGREYTVSDEGLVLVTPSMFIPPLVANSFAYKNVGVGTDAIGDSITFEVLISSLPADGDGSGPRVTVHVARPVWGGRKYKVERLVLNERCGGGGGGTSVSTGVVFGIFPFYVPQFSDEPCTRGMCHPGLLTSRRARNLAFTPSHYLIFGGQQFTALNAHFYDLAKPAIPVATLWQLERWARPPRAPTATAPPSEYDKWASGEANMPLFTMASAPDGVVNKDILPAEPVILMRQAPGSSPLCPDGEDTALRLVRYVAFAGKNLYSTPIAMLQRLPVRNLRDLTAHAVAFLADKGKQNFLLFLSDRDDNISKVSILPSLILSRACVEVKTTMPPISEDLADIGGGLVQGLVGVGKV